jgi:hypothetical protein
MPAPRKVTDEMRSEIMRLQSLGVPPSKIANRHLGGLVCRWTVWKVIKEEKRKQYVSQHTVRNDPPTPDTLDLGIQIETHQPAMLSSFNGGLGTPTPRAQLYKVIQQVSKGKLTPYERRAAELQLRKYTSGKDANAILGNLRQHLKDQMELLYGYNGNSDKNQQFGQLNDLARFLIHARKDFGKRKFRPKQLVDALLVKVFGEEAERRIQRPEKHLICPRCRKPRSYAVDKDPRFFLCLSCGRQVLQDKARFKVTVYRVDERYLRTVERLLPKANIPLANEPLEVVSS